MLDHFLTSLLQLIIVVDILGAIAYFVLGALKPKPRKETVSLHPGESIWARLPWLHRPRPVVQASDTDFDQLRRILFSYQEGLA